MKAPSHADGIQVLLLQAAADGRGPLLFGDSLERVRAALPPFVVGLDCPSVYFEFPLAGDPFLDVTILYDGLEPGTRVESDAAAGSGPMLDWFAEAGKANPGICCGFELDTKMADLPTSAVHFQPRTHTDLVMPFCTTIGEAEKGKLYLDLAARMPKGWELSFFGMFRGRPNSPLRVCGYLSAAEKAACAENPLHLVEVFDAVGFKAYDSTMIEQVTELMSTAPGSLDFQFDIYPDGSIGEVFSIDVQFGIEQPEAVRTSFANGPNSRVMNLLEQWGIADERWKPGIDATFARSLPVELPDESLGFYAFSLMPQWEKVRWTNRELQPAKLYLLAHTGFLDKK